VQRSEFETWRFAEKLARHEAVQWGIIEWQPRLTNVHDKNFADVVLLDQPIDVCLVEIDLSKGKRLLSATLHDCFV
jgi:hypothetical protein